jgi:hypothetical protein
LELDTGGYPLPVSYYDRQGAPMELLEWAAKVNESEYVTVARTEIGEGIEVSTVWLGLDHSYDRERILIFETMVFVSLEEPVVVFGREVTSEGTETYRYSTEAEAIVGHNQLVAELRGSIDVGTEHGS